MVLVDAVRLPVVVKEQVAFVAEVAASSELHACNRMMPISRKKTVSKVEFLGFFMSKNYLNLVRLSID